MFFLCLHVFSYNWLASGSDPQCPEPLGVGSGGGAEAAGEVAEGAGPPAAGRAEWCGPTGVPLAFPAPCQPAPGSKLKNQKLITS